MTRTRKAARQSSVAVAAWPPRHTMLWPYISLCFVTACASAQQAAAPAGSAAVGESPMRRQPVVVEELGRFHRSGFEVRERIVVRDDSTYRRAWRRAWGAVAAPPDPPAVDFAHELVVVVANGTAGGETVGIARAWLEQDALVVEVKPACRRVYGPPAVFTPATLARVRATTLAVRFIDATADSICR